MTIEQLFLTLKDHPLVASVQASPNSPLENTDTLLRCAKASLANGVKVLRLEGAHNIFAIREATQALTIGLIKRQYRGSEVYITPTLEEVNELIETGCEVVSIDGTPRQRPREPFESLVNRVHEAGRLVMADCDSLESAIYARDRGADIVGTTLSGYTTSVTGQGPDLDLVRALVERVALPIMAEGRYQEPWQAQAALRVGAAGVVIGGSLNDPVKQTTLFARSMAPQTGTVGAVDIGGTWIRFGTFSSDFHLESQEADPLPASQVDRLAWIEMHCAAHRIKRLGVGTGGTVDPSSGVVWESGSAIPDNVGTDFSKLPACRALNDGLASAWGHACHREFAGRRVATIALGTGVGFGIVDRGRIMMGPRGEYPRLNDLPIFGERVEDQLGGAALSLNPTANQVRLANEVANRAVEAVRTLFWPEDIVLCGGVGLAPWLEVEVQRSPFGKNAGLFGAAALVLYPPQNF